MHEHRKKILDVTCGSRGIWFNKHHPNAIYCDRRKERHETKCGINFHSVRTCEIDPDIVTDFRNLPFAENSFSLVVIDPPHLPASRANDSWLAKEYGKLDEDWQSMLHDGFQECMRVLKPDGVLIFKWSEISIPAEDVWKAIGQKPLFGHHSGKKSNTYWGCFMKGVK